MRGAMLAVILALGLSVQGCARVQSGSDLPLGHAAELAGDRHVILTAPLGSDAEAIAHAEAVAALVGGNVVAIWPLGAIDVTCYVIRLPAGANHAAASATLLSDPGVLTAQPIATFELFEAQYEDNLLPIQDSLRNMNVLAAHEITTGAGVTVAIVDSAVDVSHPDLAEQSIVFRDLVELNAPPGLAGRHGTAMAALIGADARNGSGMVGVSPDVRLLALRACWSQSGDAERCNSFSLARAINFALLNGADIINLSVGGSYDPLLAALLDAAEERGVVVVAAHGPDAAPQFPASLANVLAAIAIRPDAAAAAYAAYIAPGRDVISAKPGNRYDFFSGDSVATAHLSGVAALLLAVDAGLSPEEIRDAMALASNARRARFDTCVALSAVAPSRSMGCR